MIFKSDTICYLCFILCFNYLTFFQLIIFFSFPKDEIRGQHWINFVTKPDFVPKKNAVLCSRHFAEHCFDRTSQLKVRLLPTALPTIEVDRLKYVRIFYAFSIIYASIFNKYIVIVYITHYYAELFIKVEKNILIRAIRV